MICVSCQWSPCRRIFTSITMVVSYLGCDTSRPMKALSPSSRVYFTPLKALSGLIILLASPVSEIFTRRFGAAAAAASSEPVST